MATQTAQRYCPICGQPVAEATHNRFGEWACSEAHADQYVQEVRATKQGSAAGAEEVVGARGRERHRRGCC